MKTRPCFYLALVLVLLVGLVSAGCREGPETTLARAFVQGINTDSYTGTTQVEVRLEPVDVPLTPDDRRVIDLINDSSLRMTTRANVARGEQIATYALNVRGQALQTTVYANRDGVWISDPFAPRYVDVGSSLMTPEMKKYQEEMAKTLLPAMREFMGGYILGLESPVTVADLGKTTLPAPSGAVTVRHLRVRMNDAQAKEFFLDAMERLVRSDGLPDLMAAIMRSSSAIPGMEPAPEFTPEDEARMREEWTAAREEILADLAEVRRAAAEVRIVGEDGLLFEFFVDQSNNIRRMDAVMPFALRSEDFIDDLQGKGVFHATLRVSTTLDEINAVGPLAFPRFTAANTVTPMEFLAEFDPAQLPPALRELFEEPCPPNVDEPPLA